MGNIGKKDHGAPLDPTLAAALERLPIFPLPNAVLFPHAVLPLHVFEERYRKMARDVLASHRFLAVAMLVADGDDSSERPRVRPVAGAGEIVMAHELPDGRFNLMLRGRVRVRIERELPTEEPYRLVNAHIMPDDVPTDPSELIDADASLRALVGQLADSISDGGEHLRQLVAAQETPSDLVDVVSAALVVDPGTRQWLLETTDILKRIERVSAEVVIMTSRVGHHRMN